MNRTIPWVTAVAVLGCGTTRERAEERRVLVDVGMTGKEVVERIGRPTRVVSVTRTPGVADQTVEVWAYAMKTPADLGDGARFVLAAGALVAFCVATKGRDTTGLGGFGLHRRSCTFWVGFGADGKVRGVTDLQEER